MKTAMIRLKGEEAAEVLVYGLIGEGEGGLGEGIGAKEFRTEVKKLRGRKINLRINSAGGSVFDAAAMLAALDEHAGRIEVDIDGLAASAASVLAMAGDEIRINAAGMMMLHNPHTVAMGDAAEMR